MNSLNSESQKTFTTDELTSRRLSINRQRVCNYCNCNVDFGGFCAECPNKNWGPFNCKEDPNAPPTNLKDGSNKNANINTNLPSTLKMAKSAMASVTNWMAGGFVQTDSETLAARYKICETCEFWSSAGFANSGRCMKCGCSTWAKLRMATEKCPIGKW